MCLSWNRRPAFTLIELLVVIAVMSILMGLLMPAVQSSREAANRIVCANNLKQIGLAMHQYHDANQHLPPSRLDNETASWAWLILPFLEQENMYSQWDPTQGRIGGYSLATTLVVPQYHCPSLGPATRVTVDIYYIPPPQDPG